LKGATVTPRTVPAEGGFDHTLALLSEGYRFLPDRFERFGADMFTTRLMLRKALCVRGEDAARMFYQPGRFTRRHALPPTTMALLQDFGSVMALDGEAHRKRKAMFMSLVRASGAPAPGGAGAGAVARPVRALGPLPSVVVHQEAELVLCRAVCQWAGIPIMPRRCAPAHGGVLGDDRRRRLGRAAHLEGPAAAPPHRALGARTDRRRARRAGAAALRQRAERGRAPPRRRRPAHRPQACGGGADQLPAPDRGGGALHRFAVLAMHEHPACRERIAAGDEAYLTMFAEEVRRYYPFLPAIGGRALHDFDWHGMRIAKGTWVLLDLYGTDHHPAIWGDPEVFRPERFERFQSSGFDLIPQGGGDHYAGHRCPGEAATLDLVKSAAKLFATEIAYEVPPQDLSISLRRIPTLPASGMVIEKVRPRS
jgi:fatty-acid peroxygenase